MSYSKGPWKARRFGQVWTECGDHVETCNAPKTANARLISAAPDLYETLLAINEWWIHGRTSMPDELLNQMQSALKKAEGK